MTVARPKWQAVERDRVQKRRKALGLDGLPADLQVGLALSGGGIRSATFCLGLIRALGRAKLIPRIDYLSTVSGGGYIGAFLCSLYVPYWRRGEQPTAAPHSADDPTLPSADTDPFDSLTGRRALNHLRESGRHLLPGGAGDMVRVAALMTRNWLAVHLVIGVTLVALFLALKPLQAALLNSDMFQAWEAGWAARLPPLLWPTQWLQGYPLSRWFVASPFLPLAALALLGAFMVGSGYWLTRRALISELPRALRWVGPAGFGAIFLTIVGVALALRPDAIVPHWTNATGIGVIIALLAGGAFLAYGLAHLRDWSGVPLIVAALVISVLAAALGIVLMPMPERPFAWTRGLAFLIAAAAAATFLMKLRRSWAKPHGKSSPLSPAMQEDRVRTILTDWLAHWALAALVFGGLGLFDSVAQTIYLRMDEFALAGLTGGTSLAALIPIVRWAYRRFTGAGEGSRFAWLAELLARFGHLVALVVGLLLVGLLCTFWAVLAHAIAWGGGPIGRLDAWGSGDWAGYAGTLFFIAAAFVLLALFISQSWGFLNLSSLASFYAARLRRAYLGASNACRRTDLGVNENDPLDDIAISEEGYYAPDVLAPLHLINATVNDTASGTSNLTQRDRRGKPLTVSPAGFLYGSSARRDQVEAIPLDKAADRLPLSLWVGISGAAFSTGVGRYGSLGLSLLAGLANLRTGYWWEAVRYGWKQWDVRNFVQEHLGREFLGRFRGSNGSRWYLSDGGHFENMGVYELVRRRVGVIIAADCGADPGYAFGDLISMMRLIRIDLDAELTFFSTDELDKLLGKETRLRHLFGTLTDLAAPRDEKASRVGPYAALGQIRYLDHPERPWSPPSTFLLIKPRICGREMPELLAYLKDNPKFPQQPTSDQFFDEAQWESYFRLGERIGDALFDSSRAARADHVWLPSDLQPIRWP